MTENFGAGVVGAIVLIDPETRLPYRATGSGSGGTPDWTTILNKPTTFPPTIGATAADAVAGNDARLSDARTPTAHNHNATEVNAGVLAIGRVPTGTTGDTVALGDHTHTLGALGAAAATHSHTASQVSDSTAVGRSVLTATDAAAARTAIGAGTSSLALGTTGATAKAGDYQPAAANISDATTVGRSVLTAADAAAVRVAIGAGTSNLALGTTGSTAKAGDYQPTAANISDSTATGRSILTAADAAAVRTAAGAMQNALSAIGSLLTAVNANLGLDVPIDYATAAGLGTRPALPTNWKLRIYGGTIADADPAWMAAGDYRQIPS